MAIGPLLQEAEQYLAESAKSTGVDSRTPPLQSVISLMTRAIIIEPSSSLVHRNRGYAYGQLERFEEALADLASAIRLDSSYVLAYHDRGSLYNDFGVFDNAIADFTTALHLDSCSADSYTRRAWSHFRLCDFVKARDDATRAIASDASSSLAYDLRGLAHAQLGARQDALADLGTSIGLQPSDHEAYNSRGWIHYHFGRYGNALTDLDKAVALAPNIPNPHALFGDVYRLSGHPKDAEAPYRRALELFASRFAKRGTSHKDYLGEDIAAIRAERGLRSLQVEVVSNYERSLLKKNGHDARFVEAFK